MPIEPSIPIACISKEEFHQIDERMMKHAFAIHNQFGRLLDEVVYKRELAERCASAGIAAQCEVGIRVKHGSFVKDYFIDLLLGGSTVIEAKTAKETLAAHKGQGINYLLLADTRHGSLVNFRPSRVDRHFLSTRLTHEASRSFAITETCWPEMRCIQGCGTVWSRFARTSASDSICLFIGMRLPISPSAAETSCR